MSECSEDGCTRTAMEEISLGAFCREHMLLFLYLIKGKIDIPEFDRLRELPTDDMLKQLNEGQAAR